mmetsp:Transcript_114785/g.335670  ORF Transcript_114785/g.335670 Transcript_114785/m.335670 type:complete len:304 (-) Transcript_114785:314-1225(-)
MAAHPARQPMRRGCEVCHRLHVQDVVLREELELLALSALAGHGEAQVRELQVDERLVELPSPQPGPIMAIEQEALEMEPLVIGLESVVLECLVAAWPVLTDVAEEDPEMLCWRSDEGGAGVRQGCARPWRVTYVPEVPVSNAHAIESEPPMGPPDRAQLLFEGRRAKAHDPTLPTVQAYREAADAGGLQESVGLELERPVGGRLVRRPKPQNPFELAVNVELPVHEHVEPTRQLSRDVPNANDVRADPRLDPSAAKRHDSLVRMPLEVMTLVEGRGPVRGEALLLVAAHLRLPARAGVDDEGV